ncbi:Auxin-responsive protein IAA6 [Artemisia annua]|uniref:Auxin-responsive protein n=1 Tax=Artemisia annua TaxID=35608 RepID=A0A2U1KWC5_ARTAN|nr:Auxin-responsive protein IAA6 [Artemisia annua]
MLIRVSELNYCSDQNGSPEIAAETRNGVITVNNGYLPVKVMDGIPVGRRVDLRDHDSYESLTQKLDDLFRDFVGYLSVAKYSKVPQLQNNVQAIIA